jgi:hypothetical protein
MADYSAQINQAAAISAATMVRVIWDANECRYIVDEVYRARTAVEARQRAIWIQRMHAHHYCERC